MKSLRDRISNHAYKVRLQEAQEAAQAGIMSQESEAARKNFIALVSQVIKPAFHEFKMALREIDRDAAIVINLEDSRQQSIILTLIDRYVSLSTGKTLQLVNPKDDISNHPNAKFYEIFCVEGIVSVRQKVTADLSPIVTEVTHADICPLFVENELAGFFERAYPTSF